MVRSPWIMGPSSITVRISSLESEEPGANPGGSTAQEGLCEALLFWPYPQVARQRKICYY